MAGAPNQFHIRAVLDGAIEVGADGDEGFQLIIRCPNDNAGLAPKLEYLAFIEIDFRSFTYPHAGNIGLRDFRRR